MKLLFTSLFTWASIFCLSAQGELVFPSHNMTLHSVFAVSPSGGGSTPSGFYNDCWGYSADGREFAIFGSLESVYFVDITEPTNPVLVDQFVEVATPANGGTFSLWRDFKVYKHPNGNAYAYAVVDLDTSPHDEEGILVFDITDIQNFDLLTNPNPVRKVNQQLTHLSEAHNIFIDEPNGRLYACGTDTQREGLIVLDLLADPIDPPLLSSLPLPPYNYVHDLYVADNIAYCSHGETSTYAIWNYENPSLPFLVASVETGAYQHSSWPTQDNNYAYYCEETQNTPIGVIDISDVNYNTPLGNDIFIENTFREPLLEPINGDTANIAHNPFIKDNLLYISYYEDGLQIFDVSDPTMKQPPRVAYLDTSPHTPNYTTTLNNWGTYPFYDSGIIIATDTEFGLFIAEIEETPLAVELHGFTAQPDNNRVRLEWTSLSELHHAEYVIERSTDLESEKWEAIAEVAPKGNAPQGMHYVEWDENPKTGINYYRLRMQGTDYKTSFSEVVSVAFTPKNIMANVHPTLIKNQNLITIELEEITLSDIEVEVVDLNGQLLQQQQLSSTDGQQFQLELGDLPKGVYVLVVKGRNLEFSQRLIKQ